MSPRRVPLTLHAATRGRRRCSVGRIGPTPSAKWISACHTHTHTQSSHPVSSFMGLLPNATFGPNYQVVSISWTSSRFPSVKLLMRFGLSTVRFSICLLTLPFCLSGTRRETGSPPILATGRPPGRTPCFTPPVFTAQTPASASRCLQALRETCYFQVTMGEKNSACVGDS